MAKCEFIIVAEQVEGMWFACCPQLERLGVVASANTRADAERQAEILARDALYELLEEGWTEQHFLALGVLRAAADARVEASGKSGSLL